MPFRYNDRFENYLNYNSEKMFIISIKVDYLLKFDNNLILKKFLRD